MLDVARHRVFPVLVGIALSGACSRQPMAPTVTFPELTRPARVFESQALVSRYVLYEDGDFSLQYSIPDGAFIEYPGRFTEADSRFAFTFTASGTWSAEGSLAGDALTVRVNAYMGIDGIPGGIYRRAP